MRVKFKFIGDTGSKDLSIVQAGFMTPYEELKHGKIYSFPEDSYIVERLDANGLWRRIDNN